MRVLPRGLGLLACVLATHGCSSDITASNPYDPASPPQAQARASLDGTVYRVVSPSDDPAALADARVSLTGPGVAAEGVLVTGSDGGFAFDDLIPGTYRLEVWHAAHFPQAADLELPAGQVRTFDLTLVGLPSDGAGVAHLTGIAHKSGELVRPPGEQDHSGILVEVEDLGVRTVSNTAGAFDLFLTPGTYNIVFSAPHYNITRRNGVVVDDGAPITIPDSPVVLDANPGTVAGRVTLEGEAAGDWGDVVVSVQGGFTTTSAEDGSYRIIDVPGGDYTVSFLKTGYQSRYLAGVAVEGGRETVLPDTALALARGAITGVADLVGESSDDGVTLSLTGTGRAAVSGDGGAFLLDGVPVGTYELRASHAGFASASVPTVTVSEDTATDVGRVSLTRIRGDFSIDGGAAYSNDASATVVVTLSNDEAVAYRVSEDPTFAAGSEPFVTYPADPDVPVTLADADGPHTLYLEYQLADASVSRVFSASIVLDRVPPEATSVVIDEGSGWSRDPAGIVTLHLSAADASSAVAEVAVSNTALTSAQLATAPFVAFRDTLLHTVAAAGSDGPKTVWVYFADLAGNITDPGTSATVTLDRAPPSFTAVSIDCGARVDAAYCNDSVVDVAIGASGADQMALSNDPGIPIAVWEAFAARRRWALAPGDGLRSVYVELRDLAGNVTTVTADSVTIDTLAPAELRLTLAGPIAGGQTSGVLSASSKVDIAIAATDAGGLDQMWVANDDGFAGAAAQPFATALPGWDLLAGDGPRSVYVRVADRAGNVTTASGTLIVDTQGPILSGATLREAQASGGVIAATGATLEVATSGADELRITGDLVSAFAGQWIAVSGQIAVDLDGAADGAKTLTVEARDAAGNLARPASIAVSAVLDRTPPTGAAVTIEGGADYALARQVTLTLAASDATSGVTGVAVAEGALDCGSATYETFTAVRTFFLSPGDGIHTVVACFRDAAGLGASASDTVVLDTQAPTGVTLTLAGGAATIGYETAVLVDVTGADTVSGPTQLSMRLSEDATFAGVAFAPFATATTFDLARGDGIRTVYLQVRDAAGNVSSASDAVIVDTTAPLGGAIVLSPSDVTASTAVVATLAAVGATEMCFEGDVVGGSSDGCLSGWVPFAVTAAVTLLTGDGDKTVTVTFRDDSLLASDPASDQVRLDTTPPTGAALLIGSGGSHATEPSVTLTVIASDATTAVAELAVADVTLDCGTASYTPYRISLPWMLPGPDGSKTLVACVRDLAGNPASATATVILDSTPPTGLSLMLAGGATWTTSTSVSAAIGASDNLSADVDLEMRLGEDPSFTGVAWGTYATSSTVILGSGDATKTVYLQVRDEAGNVAAATDVIKLDTTPPESLRFDLQPDAYATSSGVTAVLGAAGATQVCFQGPVTGASSDACGATGWQNVAASVALTLIGADGLKTVSATFRDEAGLTAGPVSDAVTLDTRAPEVTSATLTLTGVVAGGAASTSLTRSSDVLLTVAGVSDAQGPVTQMRVSENPAFTGAAWQPFAAQSLWRLSATDALKTVYLQARDSAGLSSAAISATIELDQTPPRPATVLVAGGAAYVTSSTTSVDFWVGGEAVAWSTNPDAGFTPCASFLCAAAAPGETIALVLSGGAGLHRVSLFFEDAAGNVSQGFDDDVVLDATPPSPVDVRSVAPRTTTAFLDLSDASDATSGVAAYEVRAIDVDSAVVRTAAFAGSEGWMTGLPALRTYDFSARTVDHAGNPSAWSAAARSYVGLRSSLVPAPELGSSLLNDRIFTWRGLVVFPGLAAGVDRYAWCDVRERRCADGGIRIATGTRSAWSDIAMTASGDELWTFGVEEAGGVATVQGLRYQGAPDGFADPSAWTAFDVGDGGGGVRRPQTVERPDAYRSLAAAANGQVMMVAYFEQIGAVNWGRTLAYHLCSLADDCTVTGDWTRTYLFQMDQSAEVQSGINVLGLDAGEDHLWMVYPHYNSGTGDTALLLWGCTIANDCSDPSQWYQVRLFGTGGNLFFYGARPIEVGGYLYIAAYGFLGAVGETGLRVWRCPITSASTDVCTAPGDFTDTIVLENQQHQALGTLDYRSPEPRMQLEVGGGHLYVSDVDYSRDELRLARCPLASDCTVRDNWNVALLTPDATQLGSPRLAIPSGNPVVALGTSATRMRLFEPATWAPAARAIVADEERTAGVWSTWTPRSGLEVDGYRIAHATSAAPPFASVEVVSDPSAGNAAVAAAGVPDTYGTVLAYQDLDESIAEPVFRARLGGGIGFGGGQSARLGEGPACLATVDRGSFNVRSRTCPKSTSCASLYDWASDAYIYDHGCCGKTTRDVEVAVGSNRVFYAIARGNFDTPPHLVVRSLAMNATTCRIFDYSALTDAEVVLINASTDPTALPGYVATGIFDGTLFVAATTHFDSPGALRLFTCDTASQCRTPADWTTATLPTGGADYRGGGFASDASGLWWLVHLQQAGGETQTELWRCDLASTCATAADWSTRAVFTVTPDSGTYLPDPRTSSLAVYAGGPGGSRMLMTLDDTLYWCDQGMGCLERKAWHETRVSPELLEPLRVEGGFAGAVGNDLVYVGLGNVAHTMNRCESRCWDPDRWIGGFLSRGTTTSTTLLGANGTFSGAQSWTHGRIGRIDADGSVDYAFVFQEPPDAGRYTRVMMDVVLDATW